MTDILRENLQSALGAAFDLGRELGGGGMSRVFLAQDTQLGRTIVVKVLAPELVQELSVERFGREIALAAALQHANIVPVLAAGVTAHGLPYYLMPFVEGASLRDLLAGARPLPVAEVLLVLNDVCRALAYAHGRGVVHRDIKPDNVMLSGGAALVTDFGIAKAMSSARTAPASEHLTRMGTSLGSPAYMAPEQGAGDPDTDHRADLYALGAMAYELLTGTPPFGDRPAHAQLVAHFAEAPVPLMERRPDLPEPLAQVVMHCLEKDPAARPQQATDVLERLADAAMTARMGTTVGGAAPTSKRGFVMGGAVLVTAAIAAVGWFLTRTPAAPDGPDRSLLAVMPFTVRDASLDVWREGMVDILSRSFDGAGALRTVAPSTSIGKSPERADVVSATALGTSLGAGLVVFGELSPVGRDSVRARAALVDVSTGKVRYNADVSGEVVRIDALADSVAIQLLRQLSTGGELAEGARLSSIGTSSLTALKAYLLGQQYYRRGVTDSSLLAFESAVASDSLFALAWRGVASIYIRTGREGMPEAQAALDRAIRLRRGGSPRDSLLFLGDSLRLAVVRLAPSVTGPLDDIPALPVLFATLREATRRYPSDAELWMELGDAGYHFGELADVSESAVLADFRQSIALDSMMLVPYVHAYTLAMRAANFREAAGYARGLMRLSSGDAATYYGLQAMLLDSAPAFSAEVRAILDTVPAGFAAASLQNLAQVPEATDLLLAMAEQQVARLARDPTLEDSAALAQVVVMTRVHLGKATTSLAVLGFNERAQMAQAGLLSRDEVLVEARAILARQPTAIGGALSLFATARDTASLRLLVPAFAALDVQARGSGRVRRYGDLTNAFLTLARGDSVAALRAFTSVPMASCNGSPCAPLTVAQLLVNAGRDADAARLLDRALPNNLGLVNTPPLMLLRAEVAERQRDRATAQRWYARVIAQWGRGDAAVQPTVTAARAGLKRVQSGGAGS